MWKSIAENGHASGDAACEKEDAACENEDPEGAGGSPAEPLRRGSVWRLAGALSVGGAATLVFLPGFADRLVPFDIPADVWSSVGLGAPSERVEARLGEPFPRPPLDPASCPCPPAADDRLWAPLIDFIDSHAETESAVLAANGGVMATGSFPRLSYHLPSSRLYGISWDPTAELGYRFRPPDAARHRARTERHTDQDAPEATAEDTEALILPEAVRLLIIPDADVAAMLDPSHFAAERRELDGGTSVTVARLPGPSVLELGEHGDHVHIRLRRMERVQGVESSSLGPISVLRAGRVGQITGPASPNATAPRWDVYGTDLGSVFWHRDRLYMVFGDTFGAGSRWEGRNWRSNVLARLAAPGLGPGLLRIESMVTGRFGLAREILTSRKVDGIEMTVLPTSGVSTGDRMFLHYASVRTWMESGYWEVGHSGLAYSDDDGVTWVRPRSAIWPGGIGFEHAALIRHEGMVYSFGIPGGRHGPVRLRRVAEEHMLDSSAYEYWDGSGWSAAPERAVPLVPAPVGQLSVAWNPRYRVWMMMYLDPSRDAVMLRLADALTGPWGHWQFVVRGRDEPGLYAPYMVPLPDTGGDVWFTMSKWWPYNVFLMRATLGNRPGAMP